MMKNATAAAAAHRTTSAVTRLAGAAAPAGKTMTRAERPAASSRASTLSLCAASRSGVKTASAIAPASAAVPSTQAQRSASRAWHGAHDATCGVDGSPATIAASVASDACLPSRSANRIRSLSLLVVFSLQSFVFRLQSSVFRLWRKQSAQLPDRAEQVHAHGRLVQPRHAADLLRGVALVVAQHENRALPIG